MGVGPFSIQCAIVTCQALQTSDDPRAFVVTLFAQLCMLVTVDHAELRSRAGALLERVNIGEALSEATTLRTEAEERAMAAEEENELLKIALEELREENRRLQRDVAVLSASSVLT